MPNQTLRTKLEQGRADFAFQCAQNAKDNLPEKTAKEYKAYVKKMPMLIKTNGLGAALAFAFAKGSKGGTPDKTKAWGLLYNQLEKWLKKDPKHLIEFTDHRLVAQLLKEASPTYRAVTVELIAFLTWLRRFADGLIAGEGGE